ncbi:type IX secretion system membrane protein PorP/SprF [Belliella kenyensis]|uniref:Type IX secretion system membrane protein PorP/SprF n=1 Tax=Belliella kenyensis TaxID=1472724 RepID=A0ABV8EPL8_9BACT|nr:type IX secretion system membrane protein PorP/SprF [Belliella kenyensis]MCH7402589.1 type IX secretion system membrane protein PorP/SprF [Belliella kenyensis]MDN3603387.1 type IX secretion system membrane protein PorP/SprF [Belliella kenyensis]
MRKLFFLFAYLMFFSNVVAQDIQFSQFYAAPLYLNPAFAGSSEMTRVGVNYRSQWPGLGYTFNSYSAYIDHYLFDWNSGIGLIVNGTQESMSHLSTMEVGAVYSYRLQLGFRSFLRFGGQVSMVSRDHDFSQLIFGSQIDAHGGIGDFSGENLAFDGRHRFADYNFGVLFHNELIWFGLSAHHVTQPSVSFLEESISKLPVRLSAHGGVKFDLSQGASQQFRNNMMGSRELFLAFNYKHQDPFNQLDLGAQVNLQPIVFGIWYRGLPTISDLSANNESLIGLVGFSLGNGLDVGYSYDYTLSKLNQASSGGAHEVSLRFAFLAGGRDYQDRRVSMMPCFKY